jgi:hypothetical protein
VPAVLVGDEDLHVEDIIEIHDFKFEDATLRMLPSSTVLKKDVNVSFGHSYISPCSNALNVYNYL